MNKTCFAFFCLILISLARFHSTKINKQTKNSKLQQKTTSLLTDTEMAERKASSQALKERLLYLFTMLFVIMLTGVVVLSVLLATRPPLKTNICTTSTCIKSGKSYTYPAPVKKCSYFKSPAIFVKSKWNFNKYRRDSRPM